MNKKKLAATVSKIAAIASLNEVTIKVEKGVCSVSAVKAGFFIEDHFKAGCHDDFESIFTVDEILGYFKAVQGEDVRFCFAPHPHGEHKAIARTNFEKDAKRSFFWDVSLPEVKLENYLGSLQVPCASLSHGDGDPVLHCDEGQTWLNETPIHAHYLKEGFTANIELPESFYDAVKAFQAPTVILRVFDEGIQFAPDLESQEVTPDLGLIAKIRDRRKPRKNFLLAT